MAVRPVIAPNLPIVDAHHHLWERSPPYGGRAEGRYWFENVRSDIDGGHNVVSTVYIECHNGYRLDGPEPLRPVGETDLVLMESARVDRPGLCAGIVGFADLMLGDAVSPVLEAHLAAGNGRLKGIRHSLFRDDDPVFARLPKRPVGMTYSRVFRDAFSRLSPLGLSFDATAFHTQLAEVKDLALAFPDTPIIVSHAGGAIGIGNYALKKLEVQQTLRVGLAALARCPNIYIKLSGLGMFLSGSPLLDREPEPEEHEIAAEWSSIIHFCIELFGANRCMFASNFPVDNAMCSYQRLWNVFKFITKNYSAGERGALFSGTAAKAYKLPAI